MCRSNFIGPLPEKLHVEKVKERGKVDENVAKPPEELRAVEAIPYPSIKEYDEHGTIVLNGRFNGSAKFNVYSVKSRNTLNKFPRSSFMNLVICKPLEGREQKCEQNGLIICWKKDPRVGFGNRNTSEFNKDSVMKRVRDQCGEEMAGIGVTTGISDSINTFKVVTAWGNTYEFKVPYGNCFLFWIIYWEKESDKTLYKEVMTTDQTKHKYVAFTTIGRLGINPNRTAIPLDYWFIKNYDASGVDTTTEIKFLNGTPIRVKYEEMYMNATTEDLYIVSEFKAIGGGPCCHLSAKLMGNEVSKCYFKWRPVKTSCGNPCLPSPRPCRYRYDMRFGERLPTGDINPDEPQDKNAKLLELWQKFGPYLGVRIETDTYIDVVRQSILSYTETMKEKYKYDGINWERLGTTVADDVTGEMRKKNVELQANRVLYAERLVGDDCDPDDWLTHDLVVKDGDLTTECITKKIKTRVEEYVDVEGKPHLKTEILDDYGNVLIRTSEGKDWAGRAKMNIDFPMFKQLADSGNGGRRKRQSGDLGFDWLDIPSGYEITVEKHLELVFGKIVTNMQADFEKHFFSQFTLENTAQWLSNNPFGSKRLVYPEKITCEKPYTREVRQLVYICLGVETETEIAYVFSNATEDIARVRERELEAHISLGGVCEKPTFLSLVFM